jgi:hypothetical protein
MKYVTTSPFADPDAPARKLVIGFGYLEVCSLGCDEFQLGRTRRDR